MKTPTIQHEIIMRSIKIIDIGWVNVQNVVYAFIFAQIVDNIFGKFDIKKESEKPLWRVIIELMIDFWIYGVVVYIVRNILNAMPFPLNGIDGYDHSRLRELNMPVFFSFMFFIFCDYLKSKAAYLYQTITKKLNEKDAD